MPPLENRTPATGSRTTGEPARLWELHSLRFKLLLFSLLLVLVPGSVLGIVALVNARRALEDAIGRQLKEIAMDAAHVLTRTMSEERKNLRNWARQDVVRDLVLGDDEQRISRFLKSSKAGDPQYLDLLCMDVDGRVVAASDSSLIGTDRSNDRSFQLARAGKRVLAGPMPLRDGNQVLQFASPVFDRNRPREVVGVLLGLYDWQHSIDQLDSMRKTLRPIGLTVDVLVLNENGIVIGGSGSPVVADLQGRNLRDIGWQAAQEPGAGAEPTEGTFMVEHRTQALIGRVWLERFRPRWSVIVMEPLEEALAPVHGMQRQFAVVLAGVLFAALAVASLLAARMIRPLRELTDATEAFGLTGGSPLPVPVRTKDEIGRLTEAFNRMGEELKQAHDDLVLAAKFAFVGEVASQIAHEIRTPLSILRGSAQILERSIKDGETQSPELISMMIAEVDRIDRVVGGLLQIARPRKPVTQATSLAPLLERAVRFVAAQSGKRRITINTSVSPEPLVRCDPEEIYQVALNLILNALQNSPEGGRVTVRTLPSRNGRVGFEVSDEGPGIPPEVSEQIFTPFFTMREGGTGLGLAFVQRVVQAHHGTVIVESEVGQGSTFRVELPAGKEEA